METVRDRLVHDVKAVLNDAEELIRQAASPGGKQATALRDRASRRVESALARLNGLQRDLARTSREASGAADGWVKKNPWSSVGAAAALGLLIGVLVARR